MYDKEILKATTKIWQQHFYINAANYIKVEIPSAVKEHIFEVSKKMEGKRNKETTMKIDGEGITPRFFYGLLGEWAVSQQLYSWGLIDYMPDFDLSIGKCWQYDVPDFIEHGIVLGCKTSRDGHPALVREDTYYSEVICSYYPKVDVVYICGIATPEIQKQYMSLDYVANNAVRQKHGVHGGKQGFLDYDKLLPFTKEAVEACRSGLVLDHWLPLISKKTDLGHTIYYIEGCYMNFTIRKCCSTPYQYEERYIQYPFTQEDMDYLRKELKSGAKVIGYDILYYLEKLQGVWGKEPVDLKVYDLKHIFKWERGFNSKYGSITQADHMTEYIESMDTKERFRVLSLPLKEKMNKLTDDISRNFFSVLWNLLNLDYNWVLN